MIVDPKKVNLSEADIETYLWANPQAIRFEGGKVDHWLKRQYTVPSGIVDLFGQTETGVYVVVEIKNVEIDSKAVAQVCRYAFDLDSIISEVDAHTGIRYPYSIKRVLVGPSISTVVLRECEACDVIYLQFDIQFKMTIGHRQWTDEFHVQRYRAYMELADDDDLKAAHGFFERQRLAYEAAQERRIQEANGTDDDLYVEDVDLDGASGYSDIILDSGDQDGANQDKDDGIPL